MRDIGFECSDKSQRKCSGSVVCVGEDNGAVQEEVRAGFACEQEL